MARREFQQNLKKVLSGKENSLLVWNGFLGDLNGNVSITGKPNYVYATINDGQVVEVYNKIAPNIANLPVTIGFDPAQEKSDLLEILSIRNIPRFGTTDSSYHVDGHHASHEWMNPDGNTDIVYTHLRQFMPLRPTIVPPYGIYIQPAMQRINNQWQAVGGNTLDLIDYKPSPHTVVSGSSAPALFVLLSLSATSGSVTITSGSTLTVGTLALTDIPTTPTGETPLCAVRLYAMQEKISESRLSTDIIDLRWGIPTSSASSGSGSGNHNDLAGLQGGQANEYYHLTASEHAVATQASGSGQNGYLSSVDWLRFNATSGSGGISDAPIDGNYYARKDGSWTSFVPGSGSGGGSGSSGISDAPIDGKQYARRSGSWVEDYVARWIPGIFISSFFDETDESLKLFQSNDGISWSLLNGYNFSNTLRDPSIIWHGGKWWLAYTHNGSPTDVIPIYSSPDLITWTLVTTLDTSAMGNTKAYAWSPEWFEDTDGMHLLMACGNSADHQIYETHPTADDFTTWSNLVELTGTGFPADMIDPFVVKLNQTYYLFYKDDDTDFMCLATSSSLTSGYTEIHDGDWAGFGSGYEGFCLVQLDNSNWRVYFNQTLTNGQYYSDSGDEFETWSTKTAISDLSDASHGTVLQMADFAAFKSSLSALGVTTSGSASSGSGVAGAYAVSVSRTTTQTFSSGSTSAISYNNEVRDDGGFWSVANPTKLIAPITGWYYISGYCHCGAVTGYGRRLIIKKNGTTNISVESTAAPADHNDPHLNVDTLAYMEVGEYVEFFVNQNSGSDMTIAAGATGGMALFSISGSASSGSGSGNHNDLAGLQGGQANEYYHLTASEHAVATQASGSGQNGYLSSSDWLRFNATSGSGVFPQSKTPVAGYFLTGYDSLSGSFSSGSMASSSGSASTSGLLIAHAFVSGSTDTSGSSSSPVDLADMSYSLVLSGSAAVEIIASISIGDNTNNGQGKLYLYAGSTLISKGTVRIASNSIGSMGTLLWMGILPPGTTVIKVQWATAGLASEVVYNRPATTNESRQMTIKAFSI